MEDTATPTEVLLFKITGRTTELTDRLGPVPGLPSHGISSVNDVNLCRK